jgi:hypothetical protein
MPSFNRLSLIFAVYHNYIKKFYPFDCSMCKGCIFDISINHKPNTMKKETAQFLAVLVAACYLIGQLQDIYSK